VLGGIGVLCLAGLFVAGAGAALAGAPRAAGTHHGVAQMLGTTPRTWRVIAGFTQALPPGNANTETVNQFYPHTLTIYQGDSVTWTINAHNEYHTVTFGPEPRLRWLEYPPNSGSFKVINGKKVFAFNPAVIPVFFAPSSCRPSGRIALVCSPTRGPLVERDAGFDRTVLSCVMISAPAFPAAPQSCTATFPNVGTYAYVDLDHSGIPGNADVDGVVKVIARPHAVNHVWTVWAGTGSMTDDNTGFFPPSLTIRVRDSVTWKAGGERDHTVTFGLDPRKVSGVVQMGKDAHGRPILGYNPLFLYPIVPKGGIYMGGIASSGFLGLGGNYWGFPGQVFVKAHFTLKFGRPGVYRYYCLDHGPRMTGVITVLPAGA
jgi:plastocyanin